MVDLDVVGAVAEPETHLGQEALDLCGPPPHQHPADVQPPGGCPDGRFSRQRLGNYNPGSHITNQQYRGTQGLTAAEWRPTGNRHRGLGFQHPSFICILVSGPPGKQTGLTGAEG